jgi:lysozyme
MAGGRAVKTSPKGIALITEFEGFRSKAYQDVVGVWTIGYGFTLGVQPGDTITKEQAKRRLARELESYEAAVMRACTNEPNQNEFDALVCFAFNVGASGMAKSSVIKAHNRGDHQAAARAFQLWNKAGGVVYAGLTRRRAAEAALYLTPMPDDVSDPVEGPALDMPQRVDSESSLSRSPIVAGSGIAAGATAAAEVARSVSDVREALGDWLPWVLVAVAVGAAGWVMWQRYLQRSQGWA